jgi:hypothetical protein
MYEAQLMVCLVYSHVSVQHQWFAIESLSCGPIVARASTLNVQSLGTVQLDTALPAASCHV